MNTITPREASIFACFVDTVVAPAPPFPPVAATDAADFLDEWLALAPPLNRAGLRAAIRALDLGPFAFGFRRRLRRLEPAGRAAYLDRLEHHPNALARQAAKALKGIAMLCYYGDDGVMRTLGYDADANVRRGRALRARENRP